MLAYMPSLPAINQLSSFVQPQPKKDALGVDNIYLINLERRPDRKKKMDNCFNELGIEYEWIKAVDGKRDINKVQSVRIPNSPDFGTLFTSLDCFICINKTV